MPEELNLESRSATSTTGYRALNTNEFYGPLAGLVLTLLAIFLSGMAIYFWPSQKDVIFIVQLALTVTGLLFIMRIKHCVKNRLLLPLSQLHDWAQHMLNGDLNARIPQDESGKLTSLAGNINKLGESLRSLTREMDDRVNTQTITMQRKTRSLEILYDVAARSNSAKDIDELLITFFNTLTEIVYAHAGTVRLLPDDNQMRLVGSVGLDE